MQKTQGLCSSVQFTLAENGVKASSPAVKAFTSSEQTFQRQERMETARG